MSSSARGRASKGVKQWAHRLSSWSCRESNIFLLNYIDFQIYVSLILLNYFWRYSSLSSWACRRKTCKTVHSHCHPECHPVCHPELVEGCRRVSKDDMINLRLPPQSFWARRRIPWILSIILSQFLYRLPIFIKQRLLFLPWPPFDLLFPGNCLHDVIMTNTIP